jgi:cephalosporin hydroxylase
MNSSPLEPGIQFTAERLAVAHQMQQDEELKKKSLEWMVHADRYKYSYNYTWLGRPIIKYPQDIVAIQEIIWRTQPDLIIETGIAHGGSLILSASILELIGKGQVLGIDIDIREHNREKSEAHPLCKRIRMIQGSTLDAALVQEVTDYAQSFQSVMVVLDSNHTHDHVLAELRSFAPLVSIGHYLILPDTFIEYFPPGHYADRPWDVGNNPLTALRAYQQECDDFTSDPDVENKLLITEGFHGYLRRNRC